MLLIFVLLLAAVDHRSDPRSQRRSSRPAALVSTSRGPAARRSFVRSNPCPSTGRTAGAGPGLVVDHMIPLKRGGAYDPSNMQWQTIADAKVKDRVE